MAQPADAQQVRTAAATVWTLGHSTYTLPQFVAILQAHGIATVADVRRFPGSRRHPQFGADALAAGLAAQGIAYQWFEPLGGRRRPDLHDAEGSAWRHPSFRAYAQHVQTDAFAQGLESLLHVAQASRTAVMCSELLWWRCHRRLVADVLLFCGWDVLHILDAGPATPHRLAPPVHVEASGLSWAAAPDACC